MEKPNPAPKHIGIILDGNRRFAKKLMAKPWKGHEWGAKKVAKLFEWCKDVGVKELTLYAFSIQNFNRPKKEFEYLMKLCMEFFNNPEYLKQIHDNRICVRFIGRIHLFPKEVHEIMKKVMDSTKDYDDYHFNLAMAYGGREELVDAIKKIGTKFEAGELSADDVNEELVGRNLYLNHEPDLIIRTGGDHRTSNFMVWQSHYSEWFFLEKTWPEFEKEDLISCIDEFQQRGRRFGK